MGKNMVMSRLAGLVNLRCISTAAAAAAVDSRGAWRDVGIARVMAEQWWILPNLFEMQVA
jgi:hypothetical protein